MEPKLQNLHFEENIEKDKVRRISVPKKGENSY